MDEARPTRASSLYAGVRRSERPCGLQSGLLTLLLLSDFVVPNVEDLLFYVVAFLGELVERRVVMHEAFLVLAFLPHLKKVPVIVCTR